jgi:alcohol dehydrogenase class IV
MIRSFSGWPGRIVTGEDAILTIGSEAKALGGTRIAVFIDPNIAQLKPVLDAQESIRAAGLALWLFTDVEPNPTDELVERAAEEMRAFKPDLIVCIGGGSTIDTGKAANVVYTHGGTVEDYNVNTGGITRIENKLLPLIAVPSTAGTGSEVTNVSVIIGVRRGVKFGVLSPFLVPTLAMLDPKLTVGLGKGTTASTGIDALTHCIESYVSLDCCCIADAEALHGIRMIRKYLPRAYADGSDMEAREEMLNASMMAGASFNINNLGLCHQMAHQLSSYFGLAHGVANAMLLPEVMRFNLPAATKRFADIAEALGCDVRGKSDEEAALAGIEAVAQFCRDMGIPEYLDDVGVDKAKVPAMAITALEDGVGATNPRKTTVKECEEVFYKCFRS